MTGYPEVVNNIIRDEMALRGEIIRNDLEGVKRCVGRGVDIHAADDWAVQLAAGKAILKLLST